MAHTVTSFSFHAHSLPLLSHLYDEYIPFNDLIQLIGRNES
ncbi:MAG: hypothetical protein R6U40_10545 [Desulfobacterales bacterium]